MAPTLISKRESQSYVGQRDEFDVFSNITLVRHGARKGILKSGISRGALTKCISLTQPIPAAKKSIKIL